MQEANGSLVLVVGPSGAGKDSLIRGARAALHGDMRFMFPRRVVTRVANAATEDHVSISDAAFALNVAKGDYAVWWRAHGNSYGIPISIEDHLLAGRTVIFNCSRTVIDVVQRRYPHVVVAEVQVSADLLVDRIVARGRETREQALARVNREVAPHPPGTRLWLIPNDGALEGAVATFCDFLLALDHAGPDPGGRSLNQQHQQENGDNGGRRLIVVK